MAFAQKRAWRRYFQQRPRLPDARASLRDQLRIIGVRTVDQDMRGGGPVLGHGLSVRGRDSSR
jgi:hypothetical protein